MSHLRAMVHLWESVVVLLFLFFAFAAPTSFSHQGHHHMHKDAGAIPEVVPKDDKSAIQVIQEDYAKTAGAVVEKKCLDCHGGRTVFPWYYSVPGVKQMIDRDLTESKEHLDMSKGFPFGGHGTIQEDLDALAHAVQEESMPPWGYRIMHPSSRFSDEERKTVSEWIQRAKKLLSPVTKTDPQS